MSENIGSSPADSVDYARGLKGDSDPVAAKSNAEGISTSPSSAKTFASWKSGKSLAAAGESEDSIAQDRGMTHSSKPNLSNRRG